MNIYPLSFYKNYIGRNTASLEQNDKDRSREEAFGPPKLYSQETMELQARTVFHGKGRMIQGRGKSHEESFLARVGIRDAGLQNFL